MSEEKFNATCNYVQSCLSDAMNTLVAVEDGSGLLTEVLEKLSEAKDELEGTVYTNHPEEG